MGGGVVETFSDLDEAERRVTELNAQEREQGPNYVDYVYFVEPKDVGS